MQRPHVEALPFSLSIGLRQGQKYRKKWLLGLAFCSSGRIIGKTFTDGAEFHADKPRWLHMKGITREGGGTSHSLGMGGA